MHGDEHRARLEAFFDGELAPEDAAQVEAALADCGECQTDFAQLQAMRSALRTSIDPELAEVRFEGLWEGIASEIRADAPAPEPAPAPTWWERIREDLGWGRMLPLAAAAAAALAIVVLNDGMLPTMGDDTTVFPMPNDNVAFVSAVQFEHGSVFIDQDPNDPAAPLIVWHVTDET